MKRLISVVVIAVAGCASAPPSKHIGEIDQQLAKLKQDPQVAKLAPDELAAAEAAVAAADSPGGDAAHAHYLAQIAQTSILIARTTVTAKREEAAYAALKAKRDAMGSTSNDITTLAVLGPNEPTSPKALPVPVPQAAPESEQPTEPASAPNTTVAMTPAAPASAAAIPAPATTSPAPAEPSQPAVASETPATGGILLQLAAGDFSGNKLTPGAKSKVHDLLMPIARAPGKTVLISGNSAARIGAVRGALTGAGLPIWRVDTKFSSSMRGVAVTLVDGSGGAGQ